jgi:hypothetical protein
MKRFTQLGDNVGVLVWPLAPLLTERPKPGRIELAIVDTRDHCKLDCQLYDGVFSDNALWGCFDDYSEKLREHNVI